MKRREIRSLRAIERSLSEEDPELAALLEPAAAQRRAARLRELAARCVSAGIVALALGVVASWEAAMFLGWSMLLLVAMPLWGASLYYEREPAS